MRVLIIDDEAPVLRLLRRVLTAFEDVEIIGEYTSSTEGLLAIKELTPDVCFIDIEMPGQNGIELAQKLLNMPTHIVFVTAYAQYAVQAFKVNAVDYILKPISKAEITRVIEKLRPMLEEAEAVKEGLRVQFFGDFQLSQQGQAIDWPTQKVADIFAYFVYHAGKKVEKWQLCDVFWPDVVQQKAVNNVYNAIYLMKKQLEANGICYQMTQKHGFYEFNLHDAQVDCAFVDKVFHASLKDKPLTIEQLTELEQFYEGAFLSKKDYDWCVPIRAYFEQIYLQIVEQLLQDYVQQRLYKRALLLGRKVLQLYPEQEQIAMVLMPLYFADGEFALQKFYQEYSTYFLEEVGAPISEEMEQFYKRLLNELKLTR